MASTIPISQVNGTKIQFIEIEYDKGGLKNEGKTDLTGQLRYTGSYKPAFIKYTIDNANLPMVKFFEALSKQKPTAGSQGTIIATVLNPQDQSNPINFNSGFLEETMSVKYKDSSVYTLYFNPII